MADRQARVDALLAPMLRKRVWVVLSKPVSGLDGMMPHLEDHLTWLIELERTGAVFASGPFLPSADGEPPSGEGMTILRAETREEAEALARQDPFVRAGVRTFELRPWQINEGSVSIRAHFSDGTYSFD